MEPSAVLRQLGGDAFVSTSWQRQSVYAWQAWPQPPLLLSADELAGLATDPDVQSRIVMGEAVSGDWMLIDGPVTETFFSDTPETAWSLKVRDIDRHVPALTAVREAFRFLPDWRFEGLDGLYAAPEGSISQEPRDSELFMLQVVGHTDWELPRGAVGGNGTEATTQWRCQPGDLLYLPPGAQHYGVAVTESVVYCVRFRTPTTGEMLVAWANDIATTLNDAAVAETPGTPAGELPEGTRAQLRERLRTALAPTDAALDAWLGRYLSRSSLKMETLQSKYEADRSVIRKALTNSGELVVNPAVGLLVLSVPQGLPRLFIDGQEQTFPPDAVGIIKALGVKRRVDASDLSHDKAVVEAELNLLAEGLLNGWFLFQDELE